MQAWTPNTELQHGQYIIKKVIGGGGFGETYLAEDTGLSRLVVIKTLNREQRQKPDFADRQGTFKEEGKSLARCNHPHIVKVYSTFVADGLYAIVMEHIDGDDLAIYVESYTADNGYLSEAEALGYINQIGQALECVHQQKLLHRDVKPSNIILRRETKEAVLIDFGLARELQTGQSRSMTATKTEGYAPIEQYDERKQLNLGHLKPGHYTDVYALAATLYNLLTIRVPIPANYRVDDLPLHPPKRYNQNISDSVNTAILKGMEILPENRPQTIREFREILGLLDKPVVNFGIQQPVNNVETFHGTSLQTPLINPEVELKSDVGMDYRTLQNLLKAGKWKEADEETTRVMLAVGKREKEGWLDDEQIDNFPCADLRTIDQLWVKYSNGKFGFSVQKKIYQGFGGTREYNSEIWQKFGDKVGWRKGGSWLYYKDITFDIKAPEGHLPASQLWGRGGDFGCLLSRRDL